MAFDRSLTATARVLPYRAANIINKTYRRLNNVRKKGRNFVKDSTFFPGSIDPFKFRAIYRPEVSIIDDSVFHVSNSSTSIG